MNLEELLGDLDLTVSPEGFLPLAESLTEGYAEYAAAHPEADYSALAQQFGQYLGTPKAQEIIRRNISEIIQSGGGMSGDDGTASGNGERNSERIRKIYR